ncbi:MAG: HEAT repeat domain-containing protein [Chloroflexi bacterium]|nr:HEAT repeat domain-containing protein [Chloroflexota bacterium]
MRRRMMGRPMMRPQANPQRQLFIQQLREMGFSPDPNVRKQAVVTLDGLRNPRAILALRHISENDPDPEVRALAQQSLARKVQNIGTPAQNVKTIWDCDACGTRDIEGAACPNCGSSRPRNEDYI